MRFLLESDQPLTQTLDLERLCVVIGGDEVWFSFVSFATEAQLVEFLRLMDDKCTIYIRDREVFWPPVIPVLCIHVHNGPLERVRIHVEDSHANHRKG